MAIINKKTVINRLIDDIGIPTNHRADAEKMLDAGFDPYGGSLAPKPGVNGTARDALLSFKTTRAAAPAAAPAISAGAGEMVHGVSPLPVRTLDSIAHMSPEEKIRYANEQAFRKSGVIE